MSWTTENKNVSSVNNLHLLLLSTDKSFMHIRNNKGPKIEISGTPSRIST